MGLNYNGTNITSIKYNGIDLTKLIYNRVTVWEKILAPKVLSCPNGFGDLVPCFDYDDYILSDTGKLGYKGNNGIQELCTLDFTQSSTCFGLIKDRYTSDRYVFVFRKSSDTGSNGKVYVDLYKILSYSTGECELFGSYETGGNISNGSIGQNNTTFCVQNNILFAYIFRFYSGAASYCQFITFSIENGQVVYYRFPDTGPADRIKDGSYHSVFIINDNLFCFYQCDSSVAEPRSTFYFFNREGSLLYKNKANGIFGRMFFVNNGANLIRFDGIKVYMYTVSTTDNTNITNTQRQLTYTAYQKSPEYYFRYKDYYYIYRTSIKETDKYIYVFDVCKFENNDFTSTTQIEIDAISYDAGPRPYWNNINYYGDNACLSYRPPDYTSFIPLIITF